MNRVRSSHTWDIKQSKLVVDKDVLPPTSSVRRSKNNPGNAYVRSHVGDCVSRKT